MYFRSDLEIAAALKDFKSLKIEGPEVCDKFFHKYTPGNVLDFANSPFERFADYETLLRILQECDSDKYKRLHKGTPFYFMCWLAFDLKNYEKALFYLDAGVSEDIRNVSDWKSRPGSDFLFLRTPQLQVAGRVVKKLRDVLENEINRFNLATPGHITINFLVEGFVEKIIEDIKKRTIITALYTFILEFEDRHTGLLLRSEGGGSIEPFLTHLFKGGLIFESILKTVYPSKKTLNDIFKSHEFKKDFDFDVGTSANSLQEILDEINDNGIERAFETVSKIRNTTGHDLVWDDVFNDPQNYRKLFEQQVNAFLYLIEKKYIAC